MIDKRGDGCCYLHHLFLVLPFHMVGMNRAIALFIRDTHVRMTVNPILYSHANPKFVVDPSSEAPS